MFNKAQKGHLLSAKKEFREVILSDSFDVTNTKKLALNLLTTIFMCIAIVSEKES